MAKNTDTDLMSDALRLAKLGDAFVNAAKVVELLETKDAQIAERNRKLDDLMKRTTEALAKSKTAEEDAQKSIAAAQAMITKASAEVVKAQEEASAKALAAIAAADGKAKSIIAQAETKAKDIEDRAAKAAAHVADLAKQEADILARIAKAREAAKALLGG